MKTSFQLKPKHIEARRYLSELNEQQLMDLVLMVDRYKANKNIFLKMLLLLGSALGMSVISGCSSNDLKDASIEEEKCIFLSKLNNRELGELVAAELLKKTEARLEAEDKEKAEAKLKAEDNTSPE